MSRVWAAALMAASVLFIGCGGSTRTVTVGGATSATSSSATSSSATTLTNDPLCQNGVDSGNGMPCTPVSDATATTDTAGANTSSDTGSSGGSIPSVPVGTNQPLSADQENEEIDMTVTAVQRLAGDQFNTPDSGKRYVGVYVKYHNTGSTTFDDSPGNEVTLITNHDDTISSDIADVADCHNSGDLKVGAGETLRSCVVFQVPNNRRIKSVRVSLDSGNDAPGDWIYH